MLETLRLIGSNTLIRAPESLITVSDSRTPNKGAHTAGGVKTILEIVEKNTVGRDHTTIRKLSHIDRNIFLAYYIP